MEDVSLHIGGEYVCGNNENRLHSNKIKPIVKEKKKQEAWSVTGNFQDDYKQDTFKNNPCDVFLKNNNCYNTIAIKHHRIKAEWTIPYMIIVLSLIQIGIYTLGGVKIRKLFLFIPERRSEAWRYVSYVFLHSGILHLLINVFIQCSVSIPLEGSQGRLRCLGVYFGGAIVGALGTSLFQPGLRMVGASAAVYSLLTSHLTDIVLNPYSSYRRARCLVVVFLCVADVLTYLVPSCDTCFWMVNTNINGDLRVGTEAHICGALGGVIISTAIYTSTLETRKYLILCSRLVAGLIIFSFVAFVTAYNTIYKH